MRLLARPLRATAVRPDDLVPRDELVADFEPSHRSVCPADTATNSLVIDESELANSMSNGLGAISG